MVSEQSYMSARKWSLVVNSHLRVAVGHPILAVGELKEAQRVPVREHVTPFNTAGHLPVARGGHPCFPTGALRAHTSIRSHVAEEKSYWRWKIAEWCQLGVVQPPFDYFAMRYFERSAADIQKILTKS
jgi:hypothetical protein